MTKKTKKKIIVSKVAEKFTFNNAEYLKVGLRFVFFSIIFSLLLTLSQTSHLSEISDTCTKCARFS